VSEFRALKSDELPAGEGAGTQIRRVRTDDGHVMVARLTDGRLVAFAPSCPHQVTPLDDATLHDGVLRCPRHGYQYDAGTGVNVFPTRDARPENLWKLKPKFLPVYDVEERDGWIWVSTTAKPPPDSWDPSLEERPAGAADDPPPAASPIPVAPPAGVEQSMKFVTATAGEELEIRVAATPVPGYEWRLELVGDLLTIVDNQFEGGDMPCQRVRLVARGAGAATLTCTYASMIDGQTAAVRTYIVRVAQ
jgi:nitrite reductase/ring-hydroxylating ferredoxin subunit